MPLCRLAAALLLMMAVALPGLATEPGIRQVVQSIEEEWAQIFYRLPADQQAGKLTALLPRLEALAARHPRDAEPLVMESLVLCSLAAAEGGFKALKRVERARELLIKSLTLDPLAMEGSAHVTLGNLYYRLPGWPLSFGDDDAAEKHLTTALQYFPEALDTNYFYGDFLLEQGEFAKALTYLERAEKAPVRPLSRLSDLQLKKELPQALKDAREGNEERANFFSRLLTSILD